MDFSAGKHLEFKSPAMSIFKTGGPATLTSAAKIAQQWNSSGDCRSGLYLCVCVFRPNLSPLCALAHVTVVALIFSCLLVAQAACGVIPNKIKNEALNETIQLLRREGLQTVLEKLVSFLCTITTFYCNQSSLNVLMCRNRKGRVVQCIKWQNLNSTK